MKIAIPVENGRLHDHFGGCRQFALIHVDAQNKLTLRTDIVAAPQHKPGLFPLWLREQGVKVVIAGGIGKRALASFADYGIVVRAATHGAAIEPLVAAYLDGRLTTTPDGCTHDEHHHHDHDHHHEHDYADESAK